MKRTFDFLAAAAGLFVFAPLILALIVVIRRGSKGPGIFAQDRIGRDGEKFCCYKLRTMAEDAPNVPTHDSSALHVTQIGKRLRYFKLDELPQLWNVLKGEMSLVGPRPCLPSQTELIKERRLRGVFSVRPGITGLAQIRGVDMSTPAQLAETDGEYINSWSFMLDLSILAKTAFSRSGRGDGLQR